MENQSKQIFLFTFLMSCSYLIQAQYLIGGKFSYRNTESFTEQSKSNEKSYLFAPELGIQLRPHQLLGFRYAFSLLKDDENVDNKNIIKTKTHDYSIFYRHRKSINKFFNLYGELALTYSINQFESYALSSVPISKNIEKTKLISISPGVEFKISPKWLINAQWGIVSYRQAKIEDMNEEKKVSGLLFQLDPSVIQIGLNYLFGIRTED